MTEGRQPTFSEQLQQIVNKVNIKVEEEKSIESLQNQLNIKADNKTFMVFMNAINTSQAIFTCADILAKQEKGHKVKIFYYGSLSTPLFDFARNRFSYLPKKEPERYDFTTQQPPIKKAHESPVIPLTVRQHVLNHLKKIKPKFIVIGIEGGLSPELIGNDRDISFRQCLISTPIICKEKNIFKKQIISKEKSYEHVIYAFQIDYSNHSMNAFEIMVDHFQSGDHIHLIWVKPDVEASNFGNDSVEAINFIFQPYKRIIKDLKLNIKIETHILNGPNVAQLLVAFANNKKYAVDFLVTYCDLMGDYSKGKELIGSVSDYCVRHSQCAVIVPKLID